MVFFPPPSEGPCGNERHPSSSFSVLVVRGGERQLSENCKQRPLYGISLSIIIFFKDFLVWEKKKWET